jgi:DNA-binding transcriptional LysR family regulator
MDNISKIDLNLLVVLDTIDAEGGVSRAAAKLNLTQPAISHALARLRVAFDDPLFVRQGRALVPTPLTRSLIAPLRCSLAGLRALIGEAGRFDPKDSVTRFTLGLRDPVELLVLPPLMRRIAAAAPGIDLRAVQAARRNLEAGLASGALDLALDVPLPLSQSVRRRRIAADALVVVARRGHPALRARFTLEAYLRQEHVMVTQRRKGPGFEDLALSEQGVSRRVRLRCRNHMAAFRVVSETDLVLTMAERYVAPLNRGFDNRILPLPIAVPTLDLYLYWHETLDRDAANSWLRGLVTEGFAAPPIGPLEAASANKKGLTQRTRRMR